MGRLSTSSCGGLWGQTYAFDPFGNMNKGASAGSTPFNASYNLKNQIASVSGSFTPNYDANGNLVDDPVAGTRGVNAFDAEGKPAMLESHTGIVFDALGRAVESGGQEFVYGPGGGKLAVMSGQTLVRADVPLPGGAAAVFNASGLAYYQHSDLLGSARLASTPGRGLYSSSAYAPFGENYAVAGTTNKVFTGQHQDIDSTTSGGQYDFLMREYSPAQSRWWSPDPAGLGEVNPEDPASWNRYTYNDGIPTESLDETGEGCTIVYGGIGQGPDTAGGRQIIQWALQNGAYVVFPYAGVPWPVGVFDVATGRVNAALGADALNLAISDGPSGQASAIGYSGGGASFTMSFRAAGSPSGVGRITYYTPGADGPIFGPLATSPYARNIAFFGVGAINELAALRTSRGDIETRAIPTKSHNLMDQMSLAAPPGGPKCETKVFLPPNKKAVGGSLSAAGCTFGEVGHWVDGKHGDGSSYELTGYMWTCPSGITLLPTGHK